MLGIDWQQTLWSESDGKNCAAWYNTSSGEEGTGEGLCTRRS